MNPPFHPVELHQVPAVKARSQHIELAAISQPGDLRDVSSTSVTGSNPRRQAFPSGATSCPKQVQ
jgi:hypothetical protein